VRSNRKDSLVQWRSVLQRVFLFSPHLAAIFLAKMKQDPAWAHVPNGGSGIKKNDSLYIDAESNLLRDLLIDCPNERTRIYTEYGTDEMVGCCSSCSFGFGLVGLVSVWLVSVWFRFGLVWLSS
jgi:hypothetical protein